jgi:hypothetical protein
LNCLEEYARTNEIKKLNLTSTPSAFKFYKNKGYQSKKEVILTIYGIDYPEIEMEKRLRI